MTDEMRRKLKRECTRGKRLVLLLGGLLSALGGTGCSLDGLLGSDKLPPNVSDPALTETPDGARGAYLGTLALFGYAFGSGYEAGTLGFVAATGLLSDELSSANAMDDNLPDDNLLDRRALPEGFRDQGVYAALQKTRGQAGQAINLLRRYLPEDSALAGHLYAIQGYTEVFLAELYCSGIPLSTLDFGGDYTVQPGSTTPEVLRRAVALFDTALTLAGDSARIMDLARVGRARALLGLDSMAAAAATVAEVVDDYRYDVRYTADSALANGATVLGINFFWIAPNNGNVWTYSVPDREGANGLDYHADDPRTQVTERTATFGCCEFRTYYYSDKYTPDGASPIVLASGVEARLIEAEAALRAGDAGTWLLKLNQLRATVGLAGITDPGTTEGRVDLLFRERAFWLFLTGHRQGDLRRLIRQYGRFQDQIYPVGRYNSIVSYGDNVTVPIPSNEFFNPLFTGCISRGA